MRRPSRSMEPHSPAEAKTLGSKARGTPKRASISGSQSMVRRLRSMVRWAREGSAA